AQTCGSLGPCSLFCCFTWLLCTEQSRSTRLRRDSARSYPQPRKIRKILQPPYPLERQLTRTLRNRDRRERKWKTCRAIRRKRSVRFPNRSRKTSTRNQATTGNYLHPREKFTR